MPRPKLQNKPLHGIPKAVAREVLYAVYTVVGRRIREVQKWKGDQNRWLLATRNWRVLPQRAGVRGLGESPKTQRAVPIRIRTLSGDVQELYDDKSAGSSSSLTRSLTVLKEAIEAKLGKEGDLSLLWEGRLVTSEVFKANRSQFWGSTLQIVYSTRSDVETATAVDTSVADMVICD